MSAKTAVAAKKTPATPATPAKVAIPSAIRKGGSNMKDIMMKLAGMGTKKAPAADKKKTRPEMKLSEETEAQFARVAPAKVLFDYLESYLKTEKSQLTELLRGEFLATLWKIKTQPANPTITARSQGKPDATALFALVAKWHVEEVKCKKREAPDDAMARMLVEVCGLSEDKAMALVATELDFSPRTTIPLTDLLAGDDALAKEAAQKLFNFLVEGVADAFEPEEVAALLVVEAKVKVLDGFVDRLCTYCQSPQELEAILTTLIKPEWHLKSCKFGVSDAMDVRAQRLLIAAGAIIKGAE